MKTTTNRRIFFFDDYLQQETIAVMITGKRIRCFRAAIYSRYLGFEMKRRKMPKTALKRIQEENYPMEVKKKNV